MTKKDKREPSDEVKRRVANRGMVFLLEDMFGAYPGKTVVRMTEPYVPGTGGELELSFVVDYLYADMIEKLYHLINREVADGKPSVDVDIHWLWDVERRDALVEEIAEKDKEHGCESASGLLEYFVVDVNLRFSKNEWAELVG